MDTYVALPLSIIRVNFRVDNCFFDKQGVNREVKEQMQELTVISPEVYTDSQASTTSAFKY